MSHENLALALALSFSLSRSLALPLSLTISRSLALPLSLTISRSLTHLLSLPRSLALPTQPPPIAQARPYSLSLSIHSSNTKSASPLFGATSLAHSRYSLNTYAVMSTLRQWVRDHSRPASAISRARAGSPPREEVLPRNWRGAGVSTAIEE
jgi:hypothetical protein